MDILPILITIVGKNNVFMDEPMERHTFIKLGGKAKYFVLPDNVNQLISLLRYLKKKQINYYIMGNGSNLIIKDGGYNGVIISLMKINYLYCNQNHIVASSGVMLKDLALFAHNQGLSGLEFAIGIPGSVGGAIYMNAGAYGSEIKDVLDSCVVINEKIDIVKKDNKEMNFAYRHSVAMDNKDVIISGKFTLNKDDKKTIKDKMDELTLKREQKQPLEYPSCGSVFKRPSGYYAGELIQKCNLSGYRINDAQVSTKHAGFIVNLNNATASDYIALIKHVQKCVFDQFQVILEPEVRIIGED